MWFSATDSHITQLKEVFTNACFLAGGVLECNFAHRRTLAELCMIFNPLHPLNGAVHLLSVPARVTRGALVAHRHSLTPPRCRTSQCCRTSQYRRTFVPNSVCLWKDLNDPVFNVVELAGFKGSANAFSLSKSAIYFCLLLFYSLHGLVVLGWGLRIDSFLTLYQPCTADSFFIIIILIEGIFDTELLN